MVERPHSESTPYQLMGGAQALKAVVDRFYALMDGSPDFVQLRQLHAPDLSNARALLLEFLSGWLGGPQSYFQRPEGRCVMSAHRRLPIGPVEVEQWLTCMNRALFDSRIDDAVCRMIQPALERMAMGMRNLPDRESKGLPAR